MPSGLKRTSAPSRLSDVRSGAASSRRGWKKPCRRRRVRRRRRGSSTSRPGPSRWRTAPARNERRRRRPRLPASRAGGTRARRAGRGGRRGGGGRRGALRRCRRPATGARGRRRPAGFAPLTSFYFPTNWSAWRASSSRASRARTARTSRSRTSRAGDEVHGLVRQSSLLQRTRLDSVPALVEGAGRGPAEAPLRRPVGHEQPRRPCSGT